ncbi:MAG: hypothetical protein HY928_16860 [Elusimicrobia bacterium]|nr:hypothetical protein [Elusimicrobiota bacterium]
MKAVVLCLVAALAWAQAPAPDSALAEMKARGVIALDALTWTGTEASVLRRLKRAERLGAFDYLRDKTGTLDGSAVQFETGQGYKRLLLTVRGHERWLFILSQEARGFFEKRGSEAKFVFQITDMKKVRLFTDEGLLTDPGVDLYLAAKRRKPVFWIDTYGRPAGTVRPPAAGTPPQAPPKALPPPPGRPPEAPAPTPGTIPKAGVVAPSDAPDPRAVSTVEALLSAGGLEITGDEARALGAASGLPEAEFLKKTTIKAVPWPGGMRLFVPGGDPLLKKVAELRKR